MLELKSISKTFNPGTVNEKCALHDLSLSVPDGDFVTIIGANGAGKSTTMNIIAGCLAATSGTVTIDGVDIVKNPLAAKKKIGYLPEIPPLYVDMKVEDFLSFVYELKGLRGDRRGALGQVCEKAGIAHVRSRIIKNLSKGYRQRVGLAAALLGEPAVLILDEPTVGLDPTQIIEIRTLIEQVGKEHTVILSSHILSEIQAVCERVIVLNEGRLVADDTPSNLEGTMQSKNSCVALVEGEPEQVLEALRSAPSVESVERLGLSEPGVYEYRIQGHENADIRRDVFNVLSEAHLPLLGTRSAHVTLEDVFLRLVGVQAAPQTEEDAQAAPQTEGEEAAEE